MSEWRVIHGDCLDVLRSMPDASVDAVVTDPPYGVMLKAKRYKARSGEIVERAGSYAFDDTPEYVRSLVVPAIKECLRIAKMCVVVTPGTRNMWAYPEPADVGCFYYGAGGGLGRWGFVCSQPILYYGRCPYLANSLGARPNSMGQTYPNDANKVDHPCAKPIRVCKWLVERSSLEAMTVLDPFCGSGTTGVACMQTGRNFIGIELDAGYCEIARRRIGEAANHLFAGGAN